MMLHEKTIELLAGFGDRFKCLECYGTGEVTKIVRHPDGDKIAVPAKCKKCKDTGGYDPIVYHAVEVLIYARNATEKRDFLSCNLIDVENMIDDFLSKLEDG